MQIITKFSSLNCFKENGLKRKLRKLLFIKQHFIKGPDKKPNIYMSKLSVSAMPSRGVMTMLQITAEPLSLMIRSSK